MKIGAHAVLFKERIASETKYILSAMANAGYEGVEMGSRFFGLDDKSRLTEILDSCGITLAGLHVGASFSELIANRDNVMQKVMDAANFLKDMSCRNIIFSGMGSDGVDIKEAAIFINELSLRCAELGVSLNYHNHAHEFENNMDIINILTNTAPSLGLCVDLGWVYAAGCDPESVLMAFKERISYVHLRDVMHQEKSGFTELGEGYIDYPALMKAVKDTVGNSGWAIVEYEDGAQDINRYTKARKFLRSFDNYKGCELYV